MADSDFTGSDSPRLRDTARRVLLRLLIWDPNFHDPYRPQRKAIEKAAKPKHKPIESELAWRRWFSSRNISQWVENPTADAFVPIRTEWLERTRTPAAVAALETFARRPSGAAVTFVATASATQHFLPYTESLSSWAGKQKLLGALLPSIKESLVNLRASGLDVQRKISDEASLFEALGNATLGAEGRAYADFVSATTRATSYSLVAMNIQTVTGSSTGRAGASPQEIMGWLIRETPEGSELVDILKTFPSFDNAIGASGSLEPLLRVLDPGVAGVLRNAAGLNPPVQQRTIGLSGL